MPATEAGVFVSAAAVGRVAFQPIVGALATGHGRAKRLHLLGLTVVAGASFILFGAVSTTGLISARVLEGLGVSAFVVSWRSLLNAWVNTSAFGRINDSAIVSQNAGRLVGPLLGGALASGMGLRAVFAGSSILCLLCLICLHLGSLGHPSQGGTIRSEATTGWRELRAEARPLRVLLLVHHVEFFCMGLWLAAWPVFALHVRRLSTMELGICFAAASAGGLMLPALRGLIGKSSIRRRLMGAMFMLALQPVAALLPEATLAILIPCMMVGGFGGALYFSAFHWILAHRIAVERTGAVYGLLGATTYLAQAAGQGLAATSQAMGNMALPVALDVVLLGLIVLLISRAHDVGRALDQLASP
jgi:MFS transporter, DHA1 family, quinolone resistance protein